MTNTISWILVVVCVHVVSLEVNKKWAPGRMMFRADRKPKKAIVKLNPPL
jgi:hypothetical protein